MQIFLYWVFTLINNTKPNTRDLKRGQNNSYTWYVLEFFLLKEVSLIGVGILFYILLITLFAYSQHQLLMTGFVVFFSLLKVIYITVFTLKKIEKYLMRERISFYRTILILGPLILLLIVSFAVDYFCLNDCDPNAFIGISTGLTWIQEVFVYIYFSMVTFATIGFGDIVPLSGAAKLVVMLEIMTSFVFVFFILSNIFTVPGSNREKSHIWKIDFDLWILRILNNQNDCRYTSTHNFRIRGWVRKDCSRR